MSSCAACDEVSFKALKQDFKDLNKGNNIGLKNTLRSTLLWVLDEYSDVRDALKEYFEFPTPFVGSRFRKCSRKWISSSDRCAIVELYFRFDNDKISKRFLSNFESWWYLNFDDQHELYFELWKTDRQGSQSLIWADYRDVYEMSLSDFTNVK
jgi:hypothetical protein